MTSRADYRWALRAGVVWIEDLNSEDNPQARAAPSVTNDVDAVLAEIAAVINSADWKATAGLPSTLGLLPVVYRDSRGCWDRIVVNEVGHFVDFAPLGAATLDDAIRAVKGQAFRRWRDRN